MNLTGDLYATWTAERSWPPAVTVFLRSGDPARRETHRALTVVFTPRPRVYTEVTELKRTRRPQRQ